MEICCSFEALKTNKYSHLKNCSSSVSKFILLGFPYTWGIQILLFSIFSGIYILTLIGNRCIICAVRWDPQLQTPMYILLASFSFLEIWFITSTVLICQPTFSLRPRSSLSLAASCSSISSSPWAPRRPSFCLSWPLTGTLLSAGPYTTPLS